MLSFELFSLALVIPVQLSWLAVAHNVLRLAAGGEIEFLPPEPLPNL